MEQRLSKQLLSTTSERSLRMPPKVTTCNSEECDHNEEGQCQLEEISLDDCYECEQYLSTE